MSDSTIDPASPLHPTHPAYAAERRALLDAIARGADTARALAGWMSEHPELALEERETSGRYVEMLSQHGFRIATGVAGMPTAFRAVWGADTAPVSIGLLAEMDALPDIGHACGHNLSGPASLLAAEALARVLPEDAIRLVVYGSPAEETGVGKKCLVEAGAFADVDTVMMAHASDMRRAHRLFLGNRKFDLVYHGRAAHAAAYPQQGVNALDAVVSFYVAVGLLRQQLSRRVRIHVIISEGGVAPNIIPERAAARVWVRALDATELQDAAARVLAAAEGAARTSGTRLEVQPGPGGSPPMWPNPPLADAYRRQLEFLDLPETDHAPDENIGSSDITHVSRVVPTIHPNFPIGSGLELHTRAFAEATTSEQGLAGLLEGARCLALTAHELARSPGLRAAVKRAGPEPESPR
ncbi:MAG: M20 family metallopeptidase [Deltaproteobacteria bacterium]|nr:M20 family metallopeptidase [Deltaproteobacteria bacterium]